MQRLELRRQFYTFYSTRRKKIGLRRLLPVLCPGSPRQSGWLSATCLGRSLVSSGAVSIPASEASSCSVRQQLLPGLLCRPVLDRGPMCSGQCFWLPGTWLFFSVNEITEQRGPERTWLPRFGPCPRLTAHRRGSSGTSVTEGLLQWCPRLHVPPRSPLSQRLLFRFPKWHALRWFSFLFPQVRVFLRVCLVLGGFLQYIPSSMQNG